MSKRSTASVIALSLLCGGAQFTGSAPAFAKTVPAQAIALYHAGLLIKKNNPAQALKDFQSSQALAPTWEPPVYEEGELLAVENFPKSIPVLLHAAALAPQDDTVWNILGWGYYQQHHFAAAEAAFAKQQRIAPQSPQALWGLANCYANSTVRAFSKARIDLTLLLRTPALHLAAAKMLAQLPPNAVDPTINPRSPVTYEDAIAMALSYRTGILKTPLQTVKAINGVGPSASVAPYVSFAAANGLLKNLVIPSFQAPANRLFIALLFAHLYGINQYDYIRPFPLTDMTSTPVDAAMTVNSLLALRLLTVAGPNRFAPNGTMDRATFAATVTNANAIMAKIPTQANWATPPAPPHSTPFIYFFSTGLPAVTVQDADIVAHKSQLSAVGLTYYPFIQDFPHGSATTREKIDHTKFILTAESASPAVAAELTLLHTTGVKPFLVLANYNNITDKADPQIVDTLLQSASSRTQLVAEVTDIVKKENLAGVTADFENVMPRDRNVYVQFMASLHQSLQGIGAQTMVCLPERSQSTNGQSAYDYAGLGKNADLVMLITYDEHIPSGAPGPIATLVNDDRVIKYAIQQIDPRKILLGAADYGYDWSGSSGVEVSMDQAIALAAKWHAKITFDSASQSPTFTYTDATGNKHVVWFENQQSLTAINTLVQDYGLRGLAVWHLGSENSGFWAAVS